ncbi:MAG: hypothetical protein NTX03_07840 [Bacteroidetes bacterium]|nr:hypothetical protein [Bacteroidota bacterium]
MNLKQIIILLAALLINCGLHAQQDSTIKDPILKFRISTEYPWGVNFTRIDTRYATQGKYELEKGKWLPGVEGGMMYSVRPKSKETKSIFSFKFGWLISSYNTDLTDANGKQMRFRQSFYKIPIMYGFRMPLNYNTVKNGFYRAIQLHVGVYGSSNIGESLGDKRDIDVGFNKDIFNTLHSGFITEISFTAFNQRGHGHLLGLRTSADFTKPILFKKNQNEIYPVYYSIGLFYNILNSYK